MDFSLAFDSPHIDWSYGYTPTLEAVHPIYGNQGLQSQVKEINTYNWWASKLDEFIPKLDWIDKSHIWVRMVLNRGLVFRSFTYPSIKPRLEALGFEESTAFACLVKYLMRPRPAVLDYINLYSTYFALPSVYSIGIHVRTGDKSMVRHAVPFPEWTRD